MIQIDNMNYCADDCEGAGWRGGGMETRAAARLDTVFGSNRISLGN